MAGTLLPLSAARNLPYRAIRENAGISPSGPGPLAVVVVYDIVVHMFAAALKMRMIQRQIVVPVCQSGRIACRPKDDGESCSQDRQPGQG